MKDLIDLYNKNLVSDLKDESRDLVTSNEIPQSINQQFRLVFACDAYYNGKNSRYFSLFKLNDNHIFKLYYNDELQIFALKVFITYYDLNLIKIDNIKNRDDFIEIGDL